MHHSVNPSSRLGVAGALQHFFYLYVFYIRLLKCAVHGHAAFGETQWPDHKAHRLDHVVQYEIIIPQWMSPARQKRSPSSSKPPPNAEIKITAEGKELVLRLERNEQLFAPEYTETWYSPSGALLSSSPQHAEHCFYHGAVRGQEGSGVALSTCRGLRGLITVNRTVSYLIEPLPNGTDADQHAVYRVESLRLQQGTCGHRHGDHADRLEDIIAGLIHTEQHGREKRDLRKNTKYVELMIVADNAEFQKHGRDLDKTRMKLLEAANYVDKFYKALNIRVALIGLEIWTDQDKISVSDNPFSTLCAFLDWRRKQLPRLKNDNAQLVTGVPFQGSTIGLAPLKAMCSEYQSGGVNSDHSHIAIGVAATMAHEMGHNFGMSHDISGCCLARPEDGGCIMASATGHPFPRVFNRCNEKELERYLGSGGGKCLFNPPNTDAMYGGRRCGNGYLEEGEECDCGEEEECSSPCCNANNCTLRAGAECAHGVCCHNCKLKSPGVLCREPSGQCDLPEYCDGTSEFCPANFYLMDGTSCEGGRAYCYTGMCLTLEQQCLLLWGPGARPAPDPCFEKVNIAGDQYGNCGKDLMGKYRRCESRHAKCGKIQCQSSAAKPLETNAVSIDTTITLNGRQFKCRGTHVYPMGQGDESVGDTLDPGLVMTGTKCGEREICFEGQCRNSSFLQADNCRAKCNGHGLCNNNHNCHCDAGWAPPFCDRKGTGGSLDSGSITTHSSLLPVLVLLPLLLAAGLAAVGLWCCYKHRLHPLKKGPAPPLEAPQTSCAPSSNGKAAANGHANPTFQLKPQDPGHLGVTPTGSPASLKQRSAITRPSVKPPPVPSSVGQQPPQQPGVSLPAPPSTVPPAVSRTPPRHGPPPSRPLPPCPVPRLGQELQNTNKPQLPKAVNSAEGLKQCLKISMLPPAGQGPKVRFQDETIHKS